MNANTLAHKARSPVSNTIVCMSFNAYTMGIYHDPDTRKNLNHFDCNTFIDTPYISTKVIPLYTIL